jgi:hypothetical protein
MESLKMRFTTDSLTFSRTFGKGMWGRGMGEKMF